MASKTQLVFGIRQQHPRIASKRATHQTFSAFDNLRGE